MSFLFELPLFGPLLEMLLTLVAPFVIVLSIVVFVHELGHYLVGRWCGIKADAFSIGFGREIFGWTDSRETRWRISILPLGGYVKFRGDADAASAGVSEDVAQMTAAERRETLTGAPIWARMLTILAGPFANFLLTIVLIFLVTLAIGVSSSAPIVGQVLKDGPAAAVGLQSGDRIVAVDGQPVEDFASFAKAVDDPGPETAILIERDGAQRELTGDLRRPARVLSVTYGGAADLACVRPGDLITEVDGAPIASFGDLRRAVERSAGAPLTLTIDRDGEVVSTELAPEVIDDLNRETREIERVYRIGVRSEGGVGVAPEVRPASVGEAFVIGLSTPWTLAQQTFGYIAAIFSDKADGSALSSFIGIANVSGEAASLGFWTFVQFIALISAAIGLMNLLPVPVLDGGHLVFYTVEAVRGRPLGERAMEIATAIGLAAVLFLMIFATANDLSPMFAKLAAPPC